MRSRVRLILGLGLPLLVVVLLLAAWAIDSSRSSGKVPRNVTVAGRDISMLPEDELALTVADLAATYASTEVQVRTPEQTYTVEAGSLGLRLDEQATISAALDVDKGTALPLRPLRWLAGFVNERTSPLRFTVDEAALEKGLGELAGNAAATNPTIVPTGSGFAIVSGEAGVKVNGEGVRAQLLERAESGDLPIVVQTQVIEREPAISDAEATALADKLTAATANGLAVTAGEHQATVNAQMYRTWVQVKETENKLAVSVDAEKVVADLSEALALDGETKDASVALVNGVPTITPGVAGKKCCAADTATRVLAAVNDGSGKVTVDLEVSEPEFSTEDAEKLGIKEPVGSTTEWKGQPQVKSFTTYFTAGQPRATNIRRIAELANGTVILPGQSFSMNEVVGKRTREKGFVEAGAIANGEHVDEVGGGVSQFATTMFNAAFFAGFDITTYQMHSEWFDRYPKGREATMGFPNPDLVWKNTSPYGVLVESTSTESSVTVRFWSTQWATAEQTGQSFGRSGNCQTVSTQRTVTFPDGTTKTDSFNARYRDPGNTTC